MSDLATWQEHNREFLAFALDEMYLRLGTAGAPIVTGEEPQTPQPSSEAVAALTTRMSHPPSLLHLGESLELSGFERELVLFCLGQEIDRRFRSDQGSLTVAGALSAIEGSHWSAFDPNGALRRWRIIQLDSTPFLAEATLRLDPDICAYLLGFSAYPYDEDRFVPARLPRLNSPVSLEAAQELVQTANVAAQRDGAEVFIELSGAGQDERIAVAGCFAELMGSSLATIDLRDLPPPGPELDRLLVRWARYARLTDTLLLAHHPDSLDWGDDGRVRRLIRSVPMPVLVSVDHPAPGVPPVALIRHSTSSLTVAGRQEVWSTALEPVLSRLGIEPDGALERELAFLSSQFRLNAHVIDEICTQAEGQARQLAGRAAPAPGVSARDVADLLREGCRRSVRARLDPVADRVPLTAVTDIQLPARERSQFEELKQQIRLDHEVNGRWGLARGHPSAVVALFAGASGTGKTQAALTLARDLGLDLYRVNLSSVLSKYIGDTEKNLQRVFQAASLGGVILLFDEADALFGKRSEVRDSHDRYANLSSAFLLQEVERANVPTILTSNMKEALDPAFSRRLHVVIDFPFPDEASRQRIWSSIFPADTPTASLSEDRLAQLVASGGTIRNIARRAAFLAAAEERAIDMGDLREGSNREAVKLGRDLTPDELAGW